jgi:hypothetical protein
VANAQNEPVSTNPLRVAGVVSQNLLKKQMSYRSQTDGGAGMPITDLFYRVGCQNSSGVHGFLVKIAPAEFVHLSVHPFIFLNQAGSL